MVTRTQVVQLTPRERDERRGQRPRRNGRLVRIEVAPDERLALPIAEAARRIGIGRTLMYDLIAAGKIHTVHIGRAHRVRVEELIAFLDRQAEAQRQAVQAG